MSSEIAPLCRVFCRALYAHTGGQPDEWRSFPVIGTQARIHARSTLAAILAYGAKAGWLLKAEPDRVALTDKGREVFGAGKFARTSKSHTWMSTGRR
jgi:hypothetical protein